MRTIVVVIVLSMLAKLALDTAAGRDVNDELIAEVFALVMVGWAARSFRAGDPPRGPWTVLAFAVGLIALGHATWGVFPFPTAIFVRHAFVLAHNLTMVVAVIWFVRVVRQSGLPGEATPRAKIVVAALTVGACVVGLWSGTLVVQSLLGKLEVAEFQDWSVTVVNSVGSISDVIVFVAAVHLARMVLPMRGGALAQPYLLLALGQATVLIMDLAVAVLGLNSYLALGPKFQYVSAFAWTAIGLAGLSQAMLIRRTRKNGHLLPPASSPASAAAHGT
jgi:hypothetical protein